MIYLASPYSDPDPEVKRMRFRAACVATGVLFQRGNLIFSPIAHTHCVKMLTGLKGEWEQWLALDTYWIKASTKLAILTIEGWEQSIGVQAEIEIAKGLKLPIEHIMPESVTLTSTFPYVFAPQAERLL